MSPHVSEKRCPCSVGTLRYLSLSDNEAFRSFHVENSEKRKFFHVRLLGHRPRRPDAPDCAVLGLAAKAAIPVKDFYELGNSPDEPCLFL